jgi:Ca2+-binding RTX toxin-like protein
VSGLISTTNLLSTQPGVSSTLTTSTTESWRNITLALDPGAGVANSFGIFQRTEERVIEEITAGAGDNQIQGAIFSNGNHVALIDAGGGNDIVNAGAYDFVYGNDGSDRIMGGRIVYGGNDGDTLIDGATLFGGAGNDALEGGSFMAGGEGGDFLRGKTGATGFYFDPAETGEDFVEDLGGVSPEDFAEWYYGSIGVDQPQEHVEFAGMYVVGDIENETNQTMVELSHENALGVKDEYASNSDMDGLAYFSLDDLRFDLARFNIPYRTSDIRFIEPLPPVPVVTANDYAALEPLYAAGLIERDTVEFGVGVGLDDVAAFFDDSGNLALTWGAGKVVHITLPTATDLIGMGIERFKFADGTIVSLAEMLARTGPAPLPTITGTENNDSLVGTFESERILGLGGNDVLVGLEGNDQLDGSDGSDNLNGGLGNDTLVGGTGSDSLVGGEDDDVYAFGPGDGVDFAFDEGGTDSVRFAQGIVSVDIAVTNDPYGTLYLVRTGSGDRLALSDWFNDTAHRIESVQFADGTTWDATELQSRIATLSATEFGDILTETENSDTIDGLGGNDEIYGLGGDDVLASGAGDDYMEGGAGNDILRGGDGADSPADWQGNNFLDGGAGDDAIFADGVPNFADGGSNFVLGGAGDDWVDSYAAGNVIAFNPGDGHDTVYAANALILSLGGGIDAAALSLSPEAGDLLLTIGANDSIRLTRQFEADPDAWPRITLQLFGSVHFYDFNAVVADFRQAVATDPLLQKFALGAVLQGHESAVSNTEALGGELAHRYATTGNLNGLSDTAIQQVLGDPDFGTAPQAIRMERANNAPALDNPIADQFAIEDTEFRFVAPANTFGDSDHGDMLIYGSTRADGSALPEWLTFNEATRTISGTPVNEDVGTVAVRITASDGAGASASDVFDLMVMNSNDTPVLVHPIADQSASTGVAFDFTLATDAFRDIDRGEVLVYRAALTNGDRLPAWLRFDAARRNFSGTPAATDAGSISIRVTASDQAGTSAADDFQIVVSKCGTGHEVDLVGMDQSGDRDRGHGKRDDGHGRKRDGGKHDDQGDNRLEHKGDRIAQWFAACIESEPRYDFEALAQALERTDRHGGALNEHEIARRWRAVGRYASALSNEHDEDARSGMDYRFNNRALLDSGAYGDGFGYAATGGALGRVADFQIILGLEEGFQRLHS